MSALSNTYGFRDVAALIEGGLVTTPVLARAASLLRCGDELLALAKQYSSECGECGGSGRLIEYDKALYIGQLCSPIGDSECDKCADIRAIINKAEGQ